VVRVTEVVQILISLYGVLSILGLSQLSISCSMRVYQCPRVSVAHRRERGLVDN